MQGGQFRRSMVHHSSYSLEYIPILDLMAAATWPVSISCFWPVVLILGRGMMVGDGKC